MTGNNLDAIEGLARRLGFDLLYAEPIAPGDRPLWLLTAAMPIAFESIEDVAAFLKRHEEEEPNDGAPQKG